MSSPRAEAFVWGSLALTLQVSRLIGVAPLRMTRERSGWRISVSPAICIYSYFVLFISHLMVFGGLIVDATLNRKNQVLTRNMFIFSTFIMSLLMIVSIATLGVLGSRTRMEKMIDCLNIIEKINFRTNQISTESPTDNKRYTAVVIFLVLINIHHLADFGLYIYGAIHENKNWIVVCLFSVYYFEFMIILLLEMQFSFLALLVNITHKFINDSLENLCLQKISNTSISFLEILNTNTFIQSVKPINIFNVISNNNRKLKVVTITDKADNNGKVYDIENALTIEVIRVKVQQLNLSFGAVCDVINELNEMYGVIMFLLMGSFFLHLVETPYYLVVYMFSSHYKMWFYRLLVQISYCVLHFSFLILAAEPGHRTEKEKDRTEMLISQLMRRTSSNDRFAQELDIFYKQIALSNMTYTPLGIFTLNRAIITALCGGVTTYLVIIFQFQALDHEAYYED